VKATGQALGYQSGFKPLIGGRDGMSQKLTLIDQWSLGLDLKILAKTLPAVIKGAGAA
jgi:lipopolysaccharide/colanic/teichoic acid biosynthesis glycosyltransferase